MYEASGSELTSVVDAGSPKSQAYETMVPSESTVPAEEKSTGSGALPMFGVAVPTAVGTTFGGPTSMVSVAEVVTPSSSVTVSVAV